MGIPKDRDTPKSSILIGFSTKTIHFQVPLFLETPPKSSTGKTL